MARPLKSGLDYFPFPTDFFDDERVLALEDEFGIMGQTVALYLLSMVYRKGYYLEWNPLVALKLRHKIEGLTGEMLDAIVGRMVEWGFFDRTLFGRESVLTSEVIQDVFFEVTRKRKHSADLPYLLGKKARKSADLNRN